MLYLILLKGYFILSPAVKRATINGKLCKRSSMTGNFWKIILIAFLFCFLHGCKQLPRDKQVRHEEKISVIRPLLFNGNLDTRLRENSGVIYFRNRLWTINDSGGDAVLYAFDSQTGKILQTITLLNGENRDWEDLAQNDGYIFIADIGDNRGIRKELIIYKVAKELIPTEGNAEVEAGKISFTYAKQKNAVGQFRSSNDCEALTVWNDTLMVFTKDRVNLKTTLYIIPACEGKHDVLPAAVYDSDGLITGADISPDGQFLVLIGYRNYVPFIWLIYDYQWPDVFRGKTRRIDFPQLYNVQTEGIAIKSMDEVYISSEMSKYPPQLFLVNIREVIDY